MRNNARWALAAASIGLSLVLWEALPAAAEPSETCRVLAGRLAGTPEELDAQSLTVLMLCVAAEVGERLGVAAVAPPTAVQSEAPPPPPPPALTPEQPPLPPRRNYGQWPSPSPWDGDWPTGSWD
jgi:hypothetical protein